MTADMGRMIINAGRDWVRLLQPIQELKHASASNFRAGIVPPSLPNHNLLCFFPTLSVIPKIARATLLEHRGVSAIHLFLVKNKWMNGGLHKKEKRKWKKVTWPTATLLTSSCMILTFFGCWLISLVSCWSIFLLSVWTQNCSPNTNSSSQITGMPWISMAKH